MRWLVEVTSIGKTDCQSFVVDAESWQKALQTTRTMRGETGPMSGFSIELLEAGFRAVDPMARLVYVIKRAPDDVPLTPVSNLPPRPTSIAPPAARAPSARPPAPAAVAPPAPVAAAPVPAAAIAPAGAIPRPGSAPPPAMKKRSSATLAFSSPGATGLAHAGVEHAATNVPVHAVEPVIPPPAPLPAVAAQSPDAAPESEIPPAENTDRELPRDEAALSEPTPGFMGHIEDAPTYVDKGSQPDLGDSRAIDAQPDPRLLADAPPTQVIFKREQEPNASSPLTYREYVYSVATGTNEEAAERVLRAQFELVKRALADRKSGKLVNLAVFDVVFQGKPPVPPLATLVWKDWKGAPLVEFPRRRSFAPAPRSPSARPPAMAPAMPVPVASADVPFMPPTSVAPPPALWGPPPGFQAPPAQMPGGVAASAVPPPGQILHAPATAPVFAQVVPSDAAFPPPPGASRPQAQPQRFTPAPMPAHQPTTGQIPNAERPSRSFSARPPPVRGRATGDELITALFEAMHDLHFLRDAIEGAEFCLGLALETLPSRAGLVHLYDINKREFVVASANGAGTEKLLLKRHSEAEPMLASAMRKRRAIVYANAANEADALTERFEMLGGARSLIVAPVMQAGRFLGVIEIINPLDNAPFTEDEGAAVSYIAEQYAEFVASRGVVTDEERISLRAPNPVR